MNTKQRVLITGGAGFIGTHLAKKLLKEGHSVTILDNLSSQIHGKAESAASGEKPSWLPGDAGFIHGSITKKEVWAAAIPGHDVIVHLASETGTGQSMYTVDQYVKVNVHGTAIMLDLLSKIPHDVKKIVQASSRAIYGEGKYFSEQAGYIYPTSRLAEDMDKGDFEVKYPGADQLVAVATDEQAKIHPSSVYGITKQSQEQLVMTVAPLVGITPVSFRYQNVYGPGQSLTNPYTGMLSIFSALIKNKQGITIFEDGLESRDFLYIEDAVQATYLGIILEEANGEIFNVGTGVPVSVSTVADTLLKNYGSGLSARISGNYRIGDIRHNFADMTKISRMLGFKAGFSFEDGAKLFCDWVSTQHIIENTYEQSVREMKAKGIYK